MKEKIWQSAKSNLQKFQRSWKGKVWLSLFLIGIILSSAIASCTGQFTQSSNVEITLVSYAATSAAYQQIIPQFTQQWKQQHHQDVVVSQSYGASGPQARALMDGLEADVVALALALDIKKIEQTGLIEPGWEQEFPQNSIVTQSVPVLITRAGNPKQIKTWSDLAKPGISVLIPNPKTSGAARWSFLALWGAITQTGGSEADAIAFTRKIFQNAPVLPKDSREASDAFFQQNQGDVLVNYENEVILAALNDQAFPYTVPEINISIENPVAIVDQNVAKHGNREVVEAFVQYLFTPEAQREFAKVGFRPVDPTVAKEFEQQFPPIKTLFTVEDLGGWNTIQEKFFETGGIFDQIEAGMER